MLYNRPRFRVMRRGWQRVCWKPAKGGGFLLYARRTANLSRTRRTKVPQLLHPPTDKSPRDQTLPPSLLYFFFFFPFLFTSPARPHRRIIFSSFLPPISPCKGRCLSIPARRVPFLTGNPVYTTVFRRIIAYPHPTVFGRIVNYRCIYQILRREFGNSEYLVAIDF